jgi:hypothetical protein
VFSGPTYTVLLTKKALAPDLKRKVDEIRAQRAGSATVREKLEVRLSIIVRLCYDGGTDDVERGTARSDRMGRTARVDETSCRRSEGVASIKGSRIQEDRGAIINPLI